MIPREILDSYLFTYVGACGLWSVNPYRECEFNCTYCITRTQGKSVPFHSIEKTVEIIANALSYVPWHIPYAIGGYTDAYPRVEERLGATRAVLELFDYYGRAFHIITKGTLVGRDADLLFANDRNSVKFSFISLDERATRVYEPTTPPPLDRLKVLKKIAALGVTTRISLQPWIPGVTNVQEVLDRTPENVTIDLDRLKIVKASQHFKIGDRLLDQREIDRLYLREKEKFAHEPRLNWHMDPRYLSRRHDDPHPLRYALHEHDGHLDSLLETGKVRAEPIRLIPAPGKNTARYRRFRPSMCADL